MTEEQKFCLSLKAIIADDENRCLVLRRSMRSKNNPGRWDLPGGKMDSGETFDSALRREVREETGLGVAFVGPFGTTMSQMPDCRVVYLIMLARALSGEVHLSEEHDAFAWTLPHDLPDVDLVPQFKAIARQYAVRMATADSPPHPQQETEA